MKFNRMLFLAGVGCLAAGAAHAVGGPSPRLVTVTPLPAIAEGDFDQLAADLSTNRLFVSGEAAGAMEVFDLKTGALVQAGGDVKSPHKPIVDGPGGDLFVADGHDGAVKVFDQKLGLVARIPVGPKPDTGVYDARNRIVYVGSRAADPQSPTSTISAISTPSRTVLRTFPVNGTTLKGMILDCRHHRILASLRDKNQIVILDLASGQVSYWTPAGVHQNVPLALDEADHRLFVGSRRPGALSVLDSRSGAVLATLPSTDVSDSMFYDAQGRVLYVTGDGGLSTYTVQPGGAVSLIGTDASIAGKSSLFVGPLHRLYVARPKTPDHGAGLEVYDLASAAR